MEDVPGGFVQEVIVLALFEPRPQHVVIDVVWLLELDVDGVVLVHYVLVYGWELPRGLGRVVLGFWLFGLPILHIGLGVFDELLPFPNPESEPDCTMPCSSHRKLCGSRTTARGSTCQL